jgi:Kef-type K+ transport system membrane component KefB
MMFENVFIEVTAILVIASGLGILGLLLRQPLIVAFLLTGVLSGPFGFGIITSYEKIELLGHIGISLLLFVVGLRLDLHLIRTTGPVALATGLGQIAFTIFFGLIITSVMGMPIISSIYVSLAMAFSSTIIIVKLLSDKKEIDALHGRIAMGFLIVQDIVAILVLIVLTALGVNNAGDQKAIWEITWIAGKGLGFLVCIGLLMRFVLPWLTGMLARSQELLVLFAVAWAVFLGALGDYLGFSKEVGAFLGGISLASTPYRETIGARLVSLRDFLLLFFFIDLGSRLEFSMVGPQISKAAVLSMFVLIGNPLIIMTIMGLMG